MNAEIILIGTEFLTGNVREENGSILARKLTELGYLVRWITVIRDEPEDIQSALKQASSRASLVVTTGGLGIEEDDATRKAVSYVVGRRLVLNEKLLAQLERWFKKSKGAPKKGYSRKAMVPARSRILSSVDGKATGFALHWGDCYFVCLPGLTEEMVRVFDEAVQPYLSERPKGRSVIAVRTLHTAGLMESEVVDRLFDLLHPRDPITIKIRSGWTGVDIEITSTGRSEREAKLPLDPIGEKLRERLGEAYYGEDRESLEQVVGQLLSRMGLRLSVAESCTGGLIGHRLTNIPGSSSYLDHVAVAYSNSSKMNLLAVPSELLRRHGAVSAAVAGAMAQGVRDRLGTDLGLSVTGIAGPAGGTPRQTCGSCLLRIGLARRG